MSYFIDVILCIIVACVLIGLTIYWFRKKCLYKVECRLMNLKHTKIIALSEKTVFAFSKKSAVSKVKNELLREVEKEVRKKHPQFRLDKIKCPNEWFVDGKQF